MREMRFGTRETIEAPAEFVFKQATAFYKFVALAREKGATVRREDPNPEAGTGLRWHIQYPLRGTMRGVVLELARKDPPQALVFDIVSPAIGGSFEVTFVATGPDSTEIEARLAVTPKTAKANIVVQSLRLTKGRLDKQFAGTVERQARKVEEMWQNRDNRV